MFGHLLKTGTKWISFNLTCEDIITGVEVSEDEKLLVFGAAEKKLIPGVLPRCNGEKTGCQPSKVVRAENI